MNAFHSKSSRLVIFVMVTISIVGCANLTERSTDGLNTINSLAMSPFSPSKKPTLGTQKAASKNAATETELVANPPARTIRFDGHEAILGNGTAMSLPTSELRAKLKPLLEKNKTRSATRVVTQYCDSSERLLAERWAVDASAKDIKLIASIRSKRSSANSKTDWNSLLKVVDEFPAVAQEYQKQRNAFALALQTTDPDEQTVTQLKKAATAVGHPIVEMDCLRLLGLRAVVAEQWSNADSLYRQALAVAVRSKNLQYQADLHLLAAEATKRNNATSDSVRTSSLNAITHQLEMMKREPAPLDIEFWLRIEQVYPDIKSWSENLSEQFTPHVTKTLMKSEHPIAVLFWSAIAQAQMDRGEMQLALLNLKKAETLASGDDIMWLRIAESKCLASIGQSEAAIAILGGPATSNKAEIASAATAALGSVKLQAGAYQQGAQMLNKSLKKAPDIVWPCKAQAMADLAIAQLIIGNTDQGLVSVHEAQTRFKTDEDVPSLLQSLENELRLLEHEGRKDDSSALEERIALLEST